MIFLWFLLIWQVGVFSTGIPFYILPSPLDVSQALWQYHELIVWHCWVSLSEIALGFLLGAIAGFGGAIVLDRFQWVRHKILPFFILCQSVPMFALLPILCLMLGYGWWPKVVVVALTVYFPVTVAFLEGLQRLPPVYTEMFLLLQAKPVAAFWWVRLPYALPYLLSGLVIAGAHAPLAVIAADWIGATAGLGYLIMYSNARLEISLMYACIFCLVVISGSLYGGLRLIKAKVLSWHYS